MQEVTPIRDERDAEYVRNLTTVVGNDHPWHEALERWEETGGFDFGEHR